MPGPIRQPLSSDQFAAWKAQKDSEKEEVRNTLLICLAWQLHRDHGHTALDANLELKLVHTMQCSRLQIHGAIYFLNFSSSLS